MPIISPIHGTPTFTYFTYMEEIQGVQEIYIADDDIRFDSKAVSQVLVTASEYGGGQVSEYGEIGPFVGDATVQVGNIAVGPGQVTVRVNVEWSKPLPIFLQFTVLTYAVE